MLRRSKNYVNIPVEFHSKFLTLGKTNKLALLSLNRNFQIFRHVAVLVVLVFSRGIREVCEVVRLAVGGLYSRSVVALDHAVALVLHHEVVDVAPGGAVEEALPRELGDVAHGVVTEVLRVLGSPSLHVDVLRVGGRGEPPGSVVGLSVIDNIFHFHHIHPVKGVIFSHSQHHHLSLYTNTLDLY